MWVGGGGCVWGWVWVGGCVGGCGAEDDDDDRGGCVRWGEGLRWSLLLEFYLTYLSSASFLVFFAQIVSVLLGSAWPCVEGFSPLLWNQEVFSD